MSLILDALRRAETERERERLAVPGLHDQGPAAGSAALAGADDAESAEAPRSRRGWLLALGAVLFSAAVALWVLKPAPAPTGAPPAAEGRVAGAEPPPGPSPSTPPAPVATDPPRRAPVLVPLPALLPDPAPPPALRVDPGAPPLQPQLPGASAEPAVRSAPSVPALPASPTAPAVPAGRPAPAESAEPAVAQTANPAAANMPLFRELPEPLRRELPPLAVNGAVYSPDAASRMLVLDGQVVREGQSVPGATQGSLVLERIGPKAATFSYKGQRFQLPL
ncbi:MAG: general secretion pathway protein GspB [Rubrivivax sp.]